MHSIPRAFRGDLPGAPGLLSERSSVESLVVFMTGGSVSARSWFLLSVLAQLGQKGIDEVGAFRQLLGMPGHTSVVPGNMCKAPASETG